MINKNTIVASWLDICKDTTRLDSSSSKTNSSPSLPNVAKPNKTRAKRHGHNHPTGKDPMVTTIIKTPLSKNSGFNPLLSSSYWPNGRQNATLLQTNQHAFLLQQSCLIQRQQPSLSAPAMVKRWAVKIKVLSKAMRVIDNSFSVKISRLLVASSKIKTGASVRGTRQSDPLTLTTLSSCSIRSQFLSGEFSGMRSISSRISANSTARKISSWVVSLPWLQGRRDCQNRSVKDLRAVGADGWYTGAGLFINLIEIDTTD